MAQFGSAPAWGAGGRWFESSHPDQNQVRLNELVNRKTRYHLQVPGLFLNSAMPRLKAMVSKLIELGFDTMNV